VKAGAKKSIFSKQAQEVTQESHAEFQVIIRNNQKVHASTALSINI
jgi:hypothetical protein